MEANRAARKAAEHGRHIFIYNNIRTNQTVYSLQRSMNNHAALSQLPYAGKKTVPAKLRKDVWRPLATVTFPLPAQGLSAYQKLREFRKLHELHWDNNKEYPMLPPETQKRIKEGKSAPTKKEKGKIIMDQKANTVADLAAVLKMQTAGEKSAEGAIQKALERARMSDLERLKLDVEEEIQVLKELRDKSHTGELPELTKQIAAVEAKLQDTGLSKSRIKDARQRALKLRIRKNMLLSAEEELAQKTEEHKTLEVATKVQNGAIPEVEKQLAEAKSELAELKEWMAEARAAYIENKEQNADGEDKRKLLKDRKARLRGRVAELERELNELVAAKEWVGARLAELKAEPERLKQMPLPKRGPLRKKILQARNPMPPVTTDRVKIRWADLFDAEYAESWPEKVQHEALGLTRHSAPDPDAAPASFPGLMEQRDPEAHDEAAEEAAEEAALEGEEGKEGKEGKVKATA
ncbi:hypothetical protein GTA08_BOTSDO01558 [Neofusicoccum parvum]|uniref:Uncharacterized protein n=1 Tax=Neofusicoccum parvum TaxID=310453 RepID=A0ACB5S0F6_9PEZI|nr:hypothetical protein GTA08_BOTSDO01558 [Neofusicoccum parvum]GME48081.1 hypothetical protein GTA08_BOTSDO01558 [Neofusicoccum parvum]